jgi:hypothetical protein
MSRDRVARTFAEPSLVPLADLLSNTVGVMVFIFIFTVVTASGASVPKVFPMERPSHLPFVLLVCRGDRLYALDADAAIEDFLAPLGKPSFNTVDTWVARFNERRTRVDSFDLAGEGNAEHQDLGFRQTVSLDLAVVASPRANRGGTAADLRRPGSELRVFLDRHPPSHRFIYFVVYPDALRNFQAARGAVRDAGYRTGWNPQAADQPLRFGLGRGGGVVPGYMD